MMTLVVTIVVNNHPGLEIVDEYAHGLTGNSFEGLIFNDMKVWPEHMIEIDDDGGKIFDEHFLYWRLAPRDVSPRNLRAILVRT